MPPKRKPIAERFWLKVDKTQECWLWTAAVSRSGYGDIRINGKTEKAHIVSYEMHHGPSLGRQIRHSCGVKLCVNPEHLITGHWVSNTLSHTVDIDMQYESKVDRSAGPNECHPWIAGRNWYGYGVFYRDGESRATRWAYKRYIGLLETFEVVRHTCDNPPCQNLLHLIKGLQADNTRDMVERGRHNSPKGMLHPRAVLDEESVRYIRQSPHLTLKELAKMYGVGMSTVRSARTYLTWKNVV